MITYLLRILYIFYIIVNLKKTILIEKNQLNINININRWILICPDIKKKQCIKFIDLWQSL